MMTSDIKLSKRLSRRKFLVTSGVVGAAGLAGCNSQSDGDGSDDSAAIDAAVAWATAHDGVVYVPPGSYRYEGGKLSIDSARGVEFRGEGMDRTSITFTDSTVSALVEITNQQLHSFTMRGIEIVGPGSGAGTDVHGLRIEGNAFSPFNLHIEGVRASDVSGTAIRIPESHASTFRRLDADGCSIGLILATHVDNVVEGIGRYAHNIDECFLWLLGGGGSGGTTVRNVAYADTFDNPVQTGVRVGSASSQEFGDRDTFVALDGVEIESATEYGIKCEEGSAVTRLDGATIDAAPNTTGVAALSFKAPQTDGVIDRLDAATNKDGAAWTNQVEITGYAVGNIVVNDSSIGSISAADSQNVVTGLNRRVNISVRPTETQTIASGTTEQLQINQPTRNFNGGWDFGTFEFTAPQQGVYRFRLVITLSGLEDGHRLAYWIERDGTQLTARTRELAGASESEQTIEFTRSAYCSEGKTVDFWMRNLGPSDFTMGDFDKTRLQIEQVY